MFPAPVNVICLMFTVCDNIVHFPFSVLCLMYRIYNQLVFVYSAQYIKIHSQFLNVFSNEIKHRQILFPPGWFIFDAVCRITQKSQNLR